MKIIVTVFTALFSLAFAQNTLINVSYDPTRELYAEFDEAFAAYWEAQGNEPVTFQQSHGGSVVFISGNMPPRTEIVPLMILSRLEQYDYAGATAIAVLLLLASFFLLFVINLLQAWSQGRTLPR